MEEKGAHGFGHVGNERSIGRVWHDVAPPGDTHMALELAMKQALPISRRAPVALHKAVPGRAEYPSGHRVFWEN